jgi:ankyrin repeat protein
MKTLSLIINNRFYHALRRGKLVEIRCLLALAPSLLRSENIDGLLPLHRAARHGNTALAKLLITKGANVNARDATGWTPLHHAADGQKVGFT